MARSSRPWVLPVAVAVIGVGWVLWLAYGTEPPPDIPPQRVPSAQSAPQPAPAERTSKDPAATQPQASAAPTPPSAGRPAGDAKAPADPPIQFVFRAPAAARVGDNFDVVVAIAARQAIGRIVIEVAYDPSVLRVRTAEEIDHGVRAPGGHEFSINPSSEGQVELVLAKRRREAMLEVPASAPLVQFEALAPGETEIRIANVSAVDAGERSLPWSAVGQANRIVIN